MRYKALSLTSLMMIASYVVSGCAGVGTLEQSACESSIVANRSTEIKVILADQGKNFDEDCNLVRDFEEQNPTIKVHVINKGDLDPNRRLVEYLHQLNDVGSDVDVYQIDVIWPGILEQFALDLNSWFDERDLMDFIPLVVQNDTVNGRLVAIPWFMDVGLLFYRKDLVETYKLKNQSFGKPPETWTWDDLETMAKIIQEGERTRPNGNKDFWGFVWQGDAYEGLTCNALEWHCSHGGDPIFKSDGTISVNDEHAIKAFERARSWINSISPPAVTSYQETQAEDVWLKGDAAFLRYWPDAYSESRDRTHLEFDWTQLPTTDSFNGRHAAALGGQQLMVYKNSGQQDAAIAFVRFMTGKMTQTNNLRERSRLPSRLSVYNDPQSQTLFSGHLNEIKSIVEKNTVARPITVTADLYNDVSIAYSTAVHQDLTDQKDAKTAMADLETYLQDLLSSPTSTVVEIEK